MQAVWQEAKSQGRHVRGPGLHDVFNAKVPGLRHEEGHVEGHDHHPASEEVEDTKLHGAQHAVEALADKEGGHEVGKDRATHAGRAGLVGVDLRWHLHA